MSGNNAEKLEPYKPPFSVVFLIESIVSREELHLVRSYLGESSIEYCNDLRQELDMLLEIWKEVGEQTEPPTVTKSIDNLTMFDPPNAREMLTMQIKLLAKGVHERNGTNRPLSFTKNDEKLIKYAIVATNNTDSVERPLTPMRKNDPEHSYHTSPVKLKQIQRSINAQDIDKVADLIRDAIQNECKALEYDIKFLQKCVEEEHDIVRDRPTSPIHEPPLSKLREVCRTLESQVLSDTTKIPPKETKTSKRPSSTKSNIGIQREILPSPPSPSKMKQKTPPSPNKVRLKPIDASNHLNHEQGLVQHSAPSSPLLGKSCLPMRPSSHRVTNFERESMLLDRASPTECWVEPSWTKGMSSSVPGSPDSGVSSRPPTRDLVTIHSRMQNWEKQTEGDAQGDLGYNTSSSSDFKTDDLASIHSTNNGKQQIPTYKKMEKNRPKIMPRPPAASTNDSRAPHTIRNSRFTRRYAKLSS
uniref:Uncharacterized protein LOC100176344 n=1 Tax=Phallusia mammillata TaxID=59560 RepID=A0A6F9DFR3_9ASCI|nr:uncharacterized protein LOC100176344 [Phallusia mammillata]